MAEVDPEWEAFLVASHVATLCPDCGQMAYSVASEDNPRWDEDRVRERLGFPTEGRCGNCGTPLLGRPDA